MPTLDTLKPGQSGTIQSIEGSDVVIQRIWEMGLTDGEAVEVVTVAPLGDPIEIRIRSYHLSLRKAEAQRVMVQLDDATNVKPDS